LPLRHARLPVLEVTQLAAEHIALAHEVHTLIERRLRHRYAGDADQHPAPGECRERDAEAVADLSQKVLSRYAYVVQPDIRCELDTVAHLEVGRPDGHAFRPQVHDQHGQDVPGDAERGHEVTHRRIGDEALVAADAV